MLGWNIKDSWKRRKFWVRGAFLGAVCALFPCFLWQAGLPPPMYGGIGEVRTLIRTPPPPYKDPLHCLLYYWPPHMEPSRALLHHHLCRDASSASFCPNLRYHLGEATLPIKGPVAISLLHYQALPLYGTSRAYPSSLRLVEVTMVRCKTTSHNKSKCMKATKKKQM